MPTSNKEIYNPRLVFFRQEIINFIKENSSENPQKVRNGILDIQGPGTTRRPTENVLDAGACAEKRNFNKGVLDSSQNLLIKILSWFRVNFFYPDARILSFNKLIKFLDKLIIENKINTIITSSPPHSIHKIALKRI